jgi:pyruvate dehydrogenase E2 component (dihydrolipoamide acetyltransferase)
VDISVAVDIGDGLITPIVKGSDSQSLSSISENLKDLVVRAKEGKLLPDEYQGGTFTISNLGMMGVDSFTAIINPPQSCILAVGSTVKKVGFSEDSPNGVVWENVMTVNLCCDHRVVDGAKGAAWLQAF